MTRSDLQALQPPVGVGQQNLAYQAQLLAVADAHQYDRLVAGDAEPPQVRLPLTVGSDDRRRRPQRRAGVEDECRQSLEEVRLLGRQFQVAELDLRVRPRQLERPRHAVRVVVLIGQRERLFARRGHGRRERHAHRRAGGNAHAPPERQHRVEDRTRRARQRAVERDRAVGATATADETAPVRLVCASCQTVGPSTAITWTAQTGALFLGRARVGGEQSRASSARGTHSVSRNSFAERRGGPRRRGAGPARPRRSWSARIPGREGCGSSASTGAPRRRARETVTSRCVSTPSTRPAALTLTNTACATGRGRQLRRVVLAPRRGRRRHPWFRRRARGKR